MQRINDLFSAWHGKNQGRISVFPAAALTETSSPEPLQAIRAFAEQHDLGYTIHLNQSTPEFEFMQKFHWPGRGRRRVIVDARATRSWQAASSKLRAVRRRTREDQC